VTFFKLIKAALEAYIAYAKWRQRTYIYKMEDEVDELAADASPVSKLRIERLAKRLKQERTL
jgi:hypothetical protein|tara:strand:- start:306 stop:491 length:186 start_codon:yes stop_codon:yes gene_type:complete